MRSGKFERWEFKAICFCPKLPFGYGSEPIFCLSTGVNSTKNIGVLFTYTLLIKRGSIVLTFGILDILRLFQVLVCLVLLFSGVDWILLLKVVVYKSEFPVTAASDFAKGQAI
jgi:hypothetical protein